MRKILNITTVLVLILLCSCTKEESYNPYVDSIVGTWTIYQYQTITNGKVSSAVPTAGTMLFDAKGKLYYDGIYNYSVNGNDLVIRQGDKKDIASIVFLNESDMILDFGYSTEIERRYLKKTE